MQRVVKTLPIERGKLYATMGGERYLLAECKAELEIREEVEALGVLGKGRVITRRDLVVLVTFAHRPKAPPDVGRIDALELRGEILRRDGCYMQVSFPQCEPLDDLDLTDGGTCTFAVHGSDNLMRRLRRT